VSLARLIGANKRYIQQTIPHIESLLCEDLAATGAHGEVIVVGHRSAEIDAAVGGWLQAGKHVVDLAGVSAAAGAERYAGVCW
jgi:GDP-mannose 6-dehydrogenase